MTKSKRATIIDVSKGANVSYQTVSRVINNHPNVAPETRERVLRVIEELNYRPRKAARSLASNQSKTLAIVTYDLSYYGPTQMFINIERAARSAGYDILVLNVDPLFEDHSPFTNRITEWAADGVLFIAPVTDIQYEQLISQLNDTPLLLIDSEQTDSVPSVIVDQHHGSYVITKHLIELGHTRICEISGPMNWHGAVARQRGFLQALREHHLEPVACIEGNWTAERGYEAAKSMLETSDFTAIVVANDQMALGAMYLLSERGVRVPEDISVVGFDDLPEARFFSPALTTVRQDFSMLGQQGMEYLIEMIENPEIAGQQRVITPELIVRDSSAPPPCG